MPLSEPQVVRYSRQILLREVGGKGQERLLSVGALATGAGSAQAVGLSCLAAGGTSVRVRDRASEPGEVGYLLSAGEVGKPMAAALGAALLDANPDAGSPPPSWGRFAELPASFSGDAPWVALGWRGEEGVAVYRSEAGCQECFQLTALELSKGPAGPVSVLLGSLGALLFQRLVLGLGEELGAVRVSAAGELAPYLLTRCAVHQGGGLPEDLSPVLAHLRAEYPREGCGAIFRGPGGWRVQPIQNVHPAPRRAYLFEESEWLGACREAESRGERVACLFHSHCDTGASFSAEDGALAAPQGQPLHPGVSYLVVAIERGRPAEAKAFRWNGKTFEVCQTVSIRL